MKKFCKLVCLVLALSLLPLTFASAAKGPETLKIGYLSWSGVSADHHKVEDYINEKFIMPKFGFKVELVPINGGSYDQTSNLYLNDGSMDIIELAWADLGSLVANGQVLPLDELLSTVGKPMYDRIDPNLWYGCQVNEETYCIPLLSRAYGANFAVFARQDLVEKYNISTEGFDTVADLEAVLDMIKENEPGILPIATNGSQLNNIVADPDGTIYSNTGNYVCGAVSEDIADGMHVVNFYETDEYLRRVTIAREWYQKGYVDENIAILSADDVDNIWNNNGAFCRFGIYAPGFGTPPKNSVMIPLGTHGEPWTGTAEIPFFGWMIPARAADPEKSMLLLNEIFTNQDLANAIQWGIEGEHYVKTGTDEREIRYPDGVTSDTVTYKNDQQIAFGDFFGGLYLEGTPSNYDEICREFNDTKKKDTYLGFRINMDNIKTPFASVNSVISQYAPQLECGAVEPQEVLPEFISALHGAGIDICIEEFQTQLDEFVAKDPERFGK